MDIKKALNNNYIIDKKMSESYAISKTVSNEKIIIPDNVIDNIKTTLLANNFFLRDENLVFDLVAGILKGNVILQGPPGTGKTTLARILSESFNFQYSVATAVEDWTSYDTIGGLFPSVDDEGREIITGKNGIIVESIIDCCTKLIHKKLENEGLDKEKEKYQGTWLILDEINRAEIDKVFGELFTLFGSSDFTSENVISLWFQQSIEKKKLWVPANYRIIGTMNNYDKQFLNDMSNALIRRFTFIDILPPPIESFDEEMNYVEKIVSKRITEKMSKINSTNINEEFIFELMANISFKEIKDIFYNILKRVRYANNGTESSKEMGYLNLQIGTAQIIDFLESAIINIIVREKDDIDTFKTSFDSAFASIIVPLMEDSSMDKLSDFKTWFSGLYNSTYEWLKKSNLSLTEI